ncbi:MAG TPA: biotin/lipoyl-binding protein, partial [Steroidobacteraceae bacterium]|nr:biotin/lipoyl-binding protein [Steroidobacteraceae bacterium]
MESSSDHARRSARLDEPRAADAQPVRDDLRERGEPREPGSAADTAAGRDGRQPWFRRRRTAVGGALALLVAVVLGGLWWWHESGLESTDDAFLEAHVVDVSPQIAGQVTRVLVDDNELVRAGQPLAQVDPAQFRLAEQQALAAQRQAQTALGQATAGVAVAQASLAQAHADLASATATAVRARQDLQ